MEENIDSLQPQEAKIWGACKLNACKPVWCVVSITNGTTDRQNKYLVSSISTLVVSHFNSVSTGIYATYMIE